MDPTREETRSVLAADKFRAYWWIVRHPFKAAAIRRHLRDLPDDEVIAAAQKSLLTWSEIRE